jgi:hypothetical protein
MSDGSRLIAVENVRVEISASRPCERSSDGINACGAEHFIDIDLCKYSGQRTPEVELPH